MFDGNGNWTSDFSAISDRDNDIKILASRFDGIFIADIKESFENCLTKDGQIAPIGAFNMGGQKITNLADGTNSGDAINKGQYDSTAVKLTGDQTIAGTKTFSSSPVLPTPETSDNSTKGATTAFVKSLLSSNGGLATWSQNANGYYKFSNGLIVQWGYASNSPVTFPTAFTSSSSYNIGAQLAGSGAGANDYGQLNSLSATGFSWVMYSGSSRLHWVAIGY